MHDNFHTFSVTTSTKVLPLNIFELLYPYISDILFTFGDRGGTVVKVLCYKSEGRWFDPSWCQLIFR